MSFRRRNLPVLLFFLCGSLAWGADPSVRHGLPKGLASPFPAPATGVQLSNGLVIDSGGNLMINAGLGGGGVSLSNGLSLDSSGNLLVHCVVGCSSGGSGTVQAAPQFTVGCYPNTPSASVIGGCTNILSDGNGNLILSPSSGTSSFTAPDYGASPVLGAINDLSASTSTTDNSFIRRISAGTTSYQNPLLVDVFGYPQLQVASLQGASHVGTILVGGSIPVNTFTPGSFYTGPLTTSQTSTMWIYSKSRTSALTLIADETSASFGSIFRMRTSQAAATTFKGFELCTGMTTSPTGDGSCSSGNIQAYLDGAGNYFGASYTGLSSAFLLSSTCPGSNPSPLSGLSGLAVFSDCNFYSSNNGGTFYQVVNLAPVSANTIFGNLTGSSAAPSFVATQGTDSKVMTAGTVSGTSQSLCTDANGGATTVSCPPGVALPVSAANGGTGQTTTVWGDPRNSTSPAMAAGADWCAGVNSLWSSSVHNIDGSNVGTWTSGGQLFCNSNPFTNAPSGAILRLPCATIVISVSWATGGAPHDTIPCIGNNGNGASYAGTVIQLCSDSKGSTGCGPNAYPSFELTATNEYPVGEPNAPALVCYSSGATWGSHFCKTGSTVSTGTATFAASTSVTGSSVTWTSAMVGGFVTDCDSTLSPACSAIGHIIAVPNSTTLTLDANWTGSANSAHAYTIFEPNVFVAYCDGCKAGSLNSTVFAHHLGPVHIDLGGIANATAYLDPAICQERCLVDGIAVTHNGGNQTHEETNQAYACGVWDRSFRTGGGSAHWGMSSPSQCSVGTNGGGTTSNGWMIEMYSILTQLTGGGPEIFYAGTVTGASGHLIQIPLAIDGMQGANTFHCPHMEFINGDGVSIGVTNAVSGIKLEGCTIANTFNGDVVHFLTPTNGTSISNTVENLTSGSGAKSLIVDDSNTGTNVTSATYIAYWQQTGSLAMLASIIDSGLTASTSPICPHGTNGAFTITGCSGAGAASTVIPVAKTSNYTLTSGDFQSASTTSVEALQFTISSTTSVTATLPSSAPAQISSQNPCVWIENSIASAPWVLLINSNSLTLDGTAYPVASTTDVGVSPGESVEICSNGSNYLVAAGSVAIIPIQVGRGGIWSNGAHFTLGAYGENGTGALAINTMYGSQLTLSQPMALGDFIVSATTAGTGSVVFYACVYNSAGTTLLWSASASIGTGTGPFTGSATQTVLARGNYLVTYGNTGTTGAEYWSYEPSLSGMSSLLNKLNAVSGSNPPVYFTAANGVSSGCPSSTGALSAESVGTILETMVGLGP